MDNSIYTSEQIKHILNPIFRAHHVRRAVLFGSYGKGTARAHSDVDIFVDSGLRGLAFFGLLEDIVNSLGKQVLQKICRHIQAVLDYCKDCRDLAEFQESSMRVEACVFNLMQVGELAKTSLSEEIKEESAFTLSAYSSVFLLEKPVNAVTRFLGTPHSSINIAMSSFV